MPRRELTGKRVLVTGASQGIGYALAVEAARRGCQVVAAARSKDLLDLLAREIRAAGGTIVTVVADVCDPTGRDAMFAAAEQEFGGLDILINNAGIGATGHFIETKPETLRQIFEVNVFATGEMIREGLPLLRRGDRPLIVNISSVFGRRGYPARSLYSASKFAIQGLSDAIRAELSKEGIGVLVVNPGLTRTNFSQNMLERSARISLDHQRGSTPEQVAVATFNAIAADRPEVTLTPRGKLLVLVNRFVPWVFEFFARRKIRELFKDEIAARQSNGLRQHAGGEYQNQGADAPRSPGT
ncbi:MAG: SDR family NAD(P)-dependent oxidoreductase [Fimbriiglobus sp.]|jgi:short-subunit dehydrogenase|nr:SDR family NAD(P)-dependent oxidoreductase [Fimbriiglobus sp.]